MNYKKSILSVVLWFVYAIIVGTGMVGTAMAVTCLRTVPLLSQGFGLR